VAQRGVDGADGADEADEADEADGVAIVDATAQRVERSRDHATQKAHYAGKKKAHTRKTLVVVNERGRLRYVSPSVPGSTHDVTLLRQSGTLEAIPPDLSLMGDCGFQGLQHDAPERSVALPYKRKQGPPAHAGAETAQRAPLPHPHRRREHPGRDEAFPHPRRCLPPSAHPL